MKETTNLENKKGILLETGTNEFEIVEFTVGSVLYGINVAKVREVINLVDVTKMPCTHPYVDGIFTLRGKVMPLVNLARCLGAEGKDKDSKIIVSELNNFFVGFRVDEVSRIHRISWTMMEAPPQVSNSDLVIGILKMSDRLILLLDFERIVAEINPEMNKKLTTIPETMPDLADKRNKQKILIAEDSRMLRDLLIQTLHTAGYTHTIDTENGAVAWDKLEQMLASGIPIEEQVQLVITDIEMPQMDGHRLSKLIKEHDRLKFLPIVIFSSLINPDMRRKGESIGVEAQIAKPEITQLIDILDTKLL
jgi:two-component system chemotaxis response regulator CheV